MSRENVCPACGDEFASSLGLAEHRCSFIHMQLAISEAGPNHELHVYQRRSGKIIWRAFAMGSAKLHEELLQTAVEIVKKGHI